MGTLLLDLAQKILKASIKFKELLFSQIVIDEKSKI